MWREIVDGIPGVRAGAPGAEELVEQVEEGLGHTLPEVLRAFLLDVDGVEDAYGTEFVWSAERVLEDNAAFREEPQFRELYAPFDDLVFFGDNGGGDQFAFRRAPDGVAHVLAWDHETDHRYVIATSFAQFLRDALTSDGGDWYVTRREEMVTLVRALAEARTTEAEADAAVDALEARVPHPAVTDLIFHQDPPLTAEEVVDRAMAYRPVAL
ncbi:SMI1/KNR4 family protein [Streptomyces sp. NPDC048172]|uniref:SMI1/KNR4 family protein n=1 Tax=Streptomyces sp. NPDC048172 TaxID=3365505 RepID=UPI0037138E3A